MMLEFFQWFFRSKSVRKSTRRYQSAFVSKSEILEARMMLAGDVLQNPANAFDVNNDGEASAMDALILTMLSSQRATIVAASEPDSQVTVQPAPPVSTAVTDNYFYDVNGDGLASLTDLTALVRELNGAGEPGDVATFHVRTTDLEGNEISTIDVDDEFLLSVFVQDTQDVEPDAGFGVFAAFVDLEYNSALASVVGDLEFGTNYPNGLSGDISTPGVFDEVG